MARGLRPLLRRLMRDLGLDARERQQRALDAWDAAVGPELAARSRPKAVEGRTLVVLVGDSAWAQEISFMKEDIVSRINREAGSPAPISDVRTYVASLPPRPPGETPAADTESSADLRLLRLTPGQLETIRELWQGAAGLDLETRRRLVQLQTLKLKRDLHLEARGWDRCPGCGSAFRPRRDRSRPLCSPCQLERRPLLVRVVKLLEEMPWVDHPTVRGLEPRCGSADYQEAREVLAGRWRRELASCQDEQRWLLLAVSLASLQRAKPVADLRPEDLEATVGGRNAARALLLMRRADHDLD